MAGLDTKYKRIHVGIFIIEILVFEWPRDHDTETQHIPFPFQWTIFTPIIIM